MSYFGSWPNYKVTKFRGVGELLFKALRISWKMDRVLVPLVIPPMLLMAYMKKTTPRLSKELPNPYTEAILQKKAEGVYDGNNIGIR